MTFTYQTRLNLSSELDEILTKCASTLSSVERALFAEAAKGRTSTSCKNEFLKKFQITARQFNACRVSIDGKIASYKAAQELSIITLKKQIELLDKQIKQLSRKPSKEKILHLKKRRKQMLIGRLTAREKDRDQKILRICFGGKKLFRAQYHLEKNGFSSHEEWRKEWEEKRNSEFFVLGSKDENGGNQTCTATVQSNGKFCLRLRLPQAIQSQYGKYIVLPDTFFAYGHDKILAALNHPAGKALSYRFKKDHKGWRIFVSVALEKVESITQEGIGAIGIDLNADHIACCETDRFGNIISKKIIPWVSYGKSTNQLKALTGDACKEIVEKSKETKKPIIIEKLDFKDKKNFLPEYNNKFSRLLSSFSYSLFFTTLIARAFKNGIQVHTVNPAYTSVIGNINYAKRYGLSVHLAAAFCIARRYQKFSEAPCCSAAEISDGKGGHVAFVLPARTRTKHVWHFWGQVKKKIRTVLAAHFRAMRNRSSSPTCSTLETG